MNWEMIGAIGEVIGAAGVMASLIYLALQIRTSNRAARQATMQELLDRQQTLMSQLTGPGDLADTFVRGLADFDSLDSRSLDGRGNQSEPPGLCGCSRLPGMVFRASRLVHGRV